MTASTAAAEIFLSDENASPAAELASDEAPVGLGDCNEKSLGELTVMLLAWRAAELASNGAPVGLGDCSEESFGELTIMLLAWRTAGLALTPAAEVELGVTNCCRNWLNGGAEARFIRIEMTVVCSPCMAKSYSVPLSPPLS